MKHFISYLFLFFAYVTFANTDSYRIMWREDPSTSMVIAWNQLSGTNPIVYYGKTDEGSNWNNYPNSRSVDRSVFYKGMNNQFARLTGLEANTAYYFVIKDSQGTSKRFWFKTIPNQNSERLSFIAGGDSRNNRTPRVNANKLVSKLRPHAVFFGGDMTNGDSSTEWIEWFSDWQNTIGTDGRMIPIVAARGNHEDSNNSIYNLFDTPSTNIYYAMSFGGDLIRAYTLNSEISISGSQTSWLQNDLTNEKNVIWKMAQYHKPMRPHVSNKSEGNNQYSNWSNLFYDNNVRLVVECDAHTVKTTWPIKPSTNSGNDEGFIREDKLGTVYVGEGCWGAPLRTNNDNKTWTRASASFNQFKWIFVDKTKIECRTIRVDNASSVGTVSDANIFQAPSNLDIWNPSSGSVVIIENTNITLPKVTLTAPLDNDVLKLNQTISIKANASKENGNIEKVEFYVNGKKIGEDLTDPYQFDWMPTQDGTYTIQVFAIDKGENRVESDIIQVFAGKVTIVKDFMIAEGNDDVEENGVSGNLYFDSSDMELVSDGSKGNQTIGLRFTNLSIPKDAIIKKAFIQFTTDETTTVSTNLSIGIEDVDNADIFKNLTNNVSSRKTISPSIPWQPTSWNVIGEKGVNQQTPDLKSLIQQMVNRTNWKANNAMVFIIQGTGERVAEAYEGSSSDAAKLHIEYEIKDIVTNVFQQKTNPSFILFPNPVSNNLMIEGSILHRAVKIDIFNTNGQNVLSYQALIGLNRLALSVEKLPKGKYIISIQNDLQKEEYSFLKK